MSDSGWCVLFDFARMIGFDGFLWMANVYGGLANEAAILRRLFLGSFARAFSCLIRVYVCVCGVS